MGPRPPYDTPRESHQGARVHKTTYAPMIYTALCIMFWMRVYPLLREVGGGWALEFSSFWAPNGTLLSMPFHRAQKTLEFQGPTQRISICVVIVLWMIYMHVRYS
jgi:hypothetical protein